MSTTRNEPVIEHQVPPKVLSLREKIGYACGDVGFNFLFDMGQLYLLMFFTDQLGLNPAIGGSVFLVAKIWDAFADITVGTWVDNRKNLGKRGKYRAFLFWGTVPLALLLIATFHVPGFSLTGRTIWAFAIYMIFGTSYSIANIPYGSLIPAMTRNPQERSVLASLRQGGGNLGLLIATVAFWPIVNAFGDDMQKGYMVAVTVFAVAGSCMIFFCYSSVKERYVEDAAKAKKPKAKAPLRQQYAQLFTNRPLIALCLANLFVFSAFNVRLAVQVYFARYILHDTWALSYLGLFSIACVFPGVIIMPWLTKKIGKRNTYVLGCLIWFIADVFAFFAVHSTVTLVVFSCFAFFGSALPNSLNWAMVSDCVDYGEWKSNLRNEALTYSAFTWFRKLSQAIAGFIPGLVLGLVGYVANAEIQTDSTIFGIRALMFIYPLVMCALAMIMIHFVYNLTDERFVEIMTELDDRHDRAELQNASMPEETAAAERRTVEDNS